jgi:hypothetical protein|tara:strand:- start:231 stop:602 length:372 start_codon:yes stop_codon:yes gene_type:complete
VYNIPINNKKGYTMNKLIITLLLVNGFVWGIFLPSQAKADDYNTAVIGHVIKENISGNGVDMSVLESEMQKLAYQFALQMTDVLEKNLPVILESLAAELRLNADSKYKCSLLEDTVIADKECS